MEYKLNLCDFELFLAVMKNKEAYECTLSIILDEKDLHLKEVKVEEVVLNKSGKRAIRLDAWALDEQNRQINTEMQNDAENDDVRKRARYYQGLIDTPALKAGKRTRYKMLPSTIIIFITQEDIFGRNLAKYTFTEQCEEIQGLHLEDGTTKKWEAVRMSYSKFLMEQGMQQGMERVNLLIQRLLSDQRFEDLKRSVEDPAYQKELLEEYHL